MLSSFSPAVTKHQLPPADLNKKGASIRGYEDDKMRKCQSVGHIFHFELRLLNGALPLRVTDIVSPVLVFPSHTEIRIETVCIVMLPRGLSLGRQAERQDSFFKFFEKKADVYFPSPLLSSSPLTRWILSHQQHLFSYHQEGSLCKTSDAVFRPLSALMHTVPSST